MLASSPVTRWEEWLGLLPSTFTRSRTVLLFWVSALPSFLALPIATRLLPEHTFARDVLLLVPWYAPPLLVALLWLVFGDVVRWHHMAHRSRQLAHSPLALVFDFDGCTDCRAGGGARVGVWNRGERTAQDVHVYIESFAPDGFTGKRELTAVGTAPGSAVTINRSSREGHAHWELLFRDPDHWRLRVLGGGGPLLRQRYEAIVSVEGTDLAPARYRVMIEPPANPPIRSITYVEPSRTHL